MAKADIPTTPALSPQAKENELIALAISNAEKQLREGTASSQIIVHFLKQGSERERLERERLIEENKLLQAKTATLEAAQINEHLAMEAIAALKRYSGSDE